MAQEKIIQFEGIGEIRLIKDTRFRRLSLRMAPGKGIWVNIPPGLSFRDGEKLVEEQKEWILKNRSKIRKKESGQTLFSPDEPYQTRYHKLQINKQNGLHFAAQLNNGILDVLYPEHLSVENPKVQDFIRKAVVETLRREAKYYLPKRTKELAQKFSFRYQSVKIQNAKTRWGSCSFENNINLNLHLIRLPQHLLDYVILHELCHTVEKNHSANFWALMEKVCPGVKKCRKELKGYSLVIF